MGFFTLNTARGLVKRSVLDPIVQWNPWGSARTFEALQQITELAVSRSQPRFLFDTSDTVIGRALFDEGGFHDDQLRWVVQQLGGDLTGRTVVDVGANIGTVALPLLHDWEAGHALAFEPDPRNFALLQCNVLLNDLGGRITARRCAIGDRAGTVQFELSDDNYGDHRVHVSAPDLEQRFNESNRKVIDVEQVTLDEALSAVGVDPVDLAVVWVDVQGHEGHVLAGAERVRATGVPFVVEYWPYGLRRSGGMDLMRDIVRESFSTVVDIGASMRDGSVVEHVAADIASVAQWLGDQPTDHTDLLLLP